MRIPSPMVAIGLVFPGLVGAAAPTAGAAEKLSFNTHIQPLLSEYCYHCHGPDSGTRMPNDAPLRLDRKDFAFLNRENGKPSIIKGNPAESEVVKRMKTSDPALIMPPPESHKVMKPEEIALIERWIAEGAEYEEHWAFVPPTRKEPPARPEDKWSRTMVDRHIHTAANAAGLQVSGPEDPRVLARRLSLDLTGMLPDPADVDAFAANPDDQAYEAMVDKLLASPRYGEHRARYWLDYVRYADTHGLHFDNTRAIWPYRDYIIRAFNSNIPFDQFTREQLAGDLMPFRSLDQLIATGFIRSNVTTNEGGTIAEEIQVNNIRDRVDTFGAAYLGLTAGCAACHDHKFDPISSKEFYQLSAFFNNTAEKPWDSNRADPEPVLRVPKEADRPAAEAALAKLAAATTTWQDLRATAESRFQQFRAEGKGPVKVDDTALELHLPLDDGKGDEVRNTAPGTQHPVFKADTNPLVWGEVSWFWPSVRLDIATRLPLGPLGDVEADEKFSAGSWLMLRQKPGGGGTGNGSLLSRMGDQNRQGQRGWEIFQEGGHILVHLVHQWPDQAIRVRAKQKIGVGDWRHIFFTYDGSGKAAGVRLYLDGLPVETEILKDTLQPGQSIRTAARMFLGRRDDYEPMRETRFQDTRFYRRALSPEEVAKLTDEDQAARILARRPQPREWTTDEKFVVLDRWFLGQADPSAVAAKAALENARQELDRITAKGDATLIAREKDTPAYADILARGVYSSRVERVEPGTPAFLPPMPSGSSKDRLGLADWLLQPDHPLTARVAVNRMWQEIFGVGLVETTGDFGIMGTRPSHPELLDALAIHFIDSGWNVKQFYKLLVMSSVYRQSSVVTPDQLAKDPANKWLSRAPRFRMDGELLRDSALQVSGLLIEKAGGPPVKPYQPEGIWDAVSMPESNTYKYKQDKGEALYRRSLYTFWKRFAPPPSLETFDAPTREVSCTRRSRTNTPLQALVLMNDPQFVEASRKLAERALRSSAESSTRLDFLARLTLARPLDDAERASIEKARQVYREHFQSDAKAAASLLAVGEAPADTQLPPAELAEWTMVASQFFNLDEFVTK